MKNIEVPFFSTTRAPDGLRMSWKSAIGNVIDSGQFILGSEVAQFERNWAKKLDIKYALGTSNGQDGLILALRALGIGEGKNVLVPAHSFIATHNAVLNVGAIPVSVDVNKNGLIDTDHLKKLKIKIDAIIVVHMHGAMCDMQVIMNWAGKLNIKVIEDCSQSHLATQNGSFSGSFGDIGVFSCYPTKNLGALGDAGIVVTNQEELHNEMRSLANYGSTPGNKYEHKSLGLNNRLDEMQAAVLNINLPFLEQWNQRRREIANQYFDGLRDSNIRFLQKNLKENVWHHFCILHPQRDALKSSLLELGIQTEIHYPNVASIECEKYSNFEKGEYPEATSISTQTLSLPMSQWHSDSDIETVIRCVRKVLLEI
jgi:dTDP-4-amino-4,6-dideoxygalactose transaminase